MTDELEQDAQPDAVDDETPTTEELEQARADETDDVDEALREAFGDMAEAQKKQEKTPVNDQAGPDEGGAELEGEAAGKSTDPNPYAAWEKWEPVVAQSGLDREQLIDGLMSAQIGLLQNPVETLLHIAEQYVPKEQMQAVLAGLSDKAGIDPLDVDVDQWRQQQPDPEVARLKRQVIEMQGNQLRQEVAQLKASGEYPLLNDKAFAQQVATTLGKYNDLDIKSAYNFVIASNPDLSARHAQAVKGAQPRRKANARDLPAGRPSSSEKVPEPNSWEEALRIAFKDS